MNAKPKKPNPITPRQAVILVFGMALLLVHIWLAVCAQCVGLLMWYYGHSVLAMKYAVLIECTLAAVGLVASGVFLLRGKIRFALTIYGIIVLAGTVTLFLLSLGGRIW